METNLEEVGECPVCGKQATHKCGGCKRTFYCNKRHQKEDWPRHKLICRAFEIAENEKLGRHLVATRDIAVGETILSELPIVWGPKPHKCPKICVGCGQIVKTSDTKCIKCLWPACSWDCKGLTDKERHGLECDLLTDKKLIPRCNALLVIRMLILLRINSKRWKLLEKLQSHENLRGPETDAYKEIQDMMNYLQPLLSNFPDGDQAISKICGLIDVNALETQPPQGSVAIYQTACLLEHHCIANTRHFFNLDDKGRPRISVMAVTGIKKGEHLSMMYTHPLWSTKNRRQHLLSTKYFSCSCERCADPTELGTHLSTLKCPVDGGFLLPKDPLDFETEWSCDSCPGTLKADELGFLEELEEKVEEAMEVATPNITRLTDLLSRIRVLLHPGHQYCITIAHTLIQLLPSDDPLKLELCKLLIQTINAVDPYGSRLALYAAITLRELAECPGEDNKKRLMEAAALLALEPPNTPEDKLHRLIKMELDYL